MEPLRHLLAGLEPGVAAEAVDQLCPNSKGSHADQEVGVVGEEEAAVAVAAATGCCS